MAFLRVRGGSISLVHGERNGPSVRHRRLHTFPGGAAELRASLEPTRWARLQLEVEQHHPDVLVDWDRLHADAQAIVERLAPDRPPLSVEERVRAVQKACRVLTRHLGELPRGDDRLWSLRCVGPALADTTRQLVHALHDLKKAPGTDPSTFLGLVLPDADACAAWVERAREALAQRRPAKAREAFGRAREADPCDPDVDNSEAIGYLERGKLDEAATLFERARDLARLQLPNPQRAHSWGDLAVRPYVRALSNLALVREQQHRYEEALALYQECLRVCPHDGVNARFAIGPVLQRMGKLHQSLVHNAEHCRNNTLDLPDPFYDMASALVQLHRPAEALDRLMDGLAINHRIASLLVKPPRRKLPDDEYMTVDSAEWAHAYLNDHGDLWPQAAVEFLGKVMSDRTLRKALQQLETLEAGLDGDERGAVLEQLRRVRQRTFSAREREALRARLQIPAKVQSHDGDAE